MRKRGQHHRGGGPLFQPKKNDATKAGFNVKVIRPTTTTETDAGIQQADFPCKHSSYLNKSPQFKIFSLDS